MDNLSRLFQKQKRKKIQEIEFHKSIQEKCGKVLRKVPDV